MDGKNKWYAVDRCDKERRRAQTPGFGRAQKSLQKMVVGNDGENYEVELKFTKANPRGTLSIKSQTTGMRSAR